MGVTGPDSSLEWLRNHYQRRPVGDVLRLIDTLFTRVLKPWYGQPRWEPVALYAEHDPTRLFPTLCEAAAQVLGVSAVAGRTFDVTVNDRKARWRVVEGRLVQRSLDQGRSWSTQYAIDAGPGRINAGICPAAAVCWLAGRSGLVLRTIDGQSWQRLAFPQDIELTSVSSPDERTATVSAADGRRFVTSDGGRTWVQQ